LYDAGDLLIMSLLLTVFVEAIKDVHKVRHKSVNKVNYKRGASTDSASVSGQVSNKRSTPQSSQSSLNTLSRTDTITSISSTFNSLHALHDEFLDQSQEEAQEDA
jgi:hypothetical protein